jgi:heme-degrading monooxygenase HmoA
MVWGWTVYARSTSIQAQPASMDAGIAHVRDEVLPALRDFDGFIGLSLMVDRESGLGITTTAWQSEDAMRRSADRVRPIRERAGQVFGGDTKFEEWEIAVMHRDHTAHEGACVRSGWLKTDPSALDGLIEVYRTRALPQIEELDGFCSASFMVDRRSGRAVASTCFESRSTLDASRDRADRIRSEGTRQANATVLDVREFELAVAHLRVPEMA